MDLEHPEPGTPSIEKSETNAQPIEPQTLLQRLQVDEVLAARGGMRLIKPGIAKKTFRQGV